MSIDQTGVVDAISTRGASVVLTISDHLDWNDELEHMYALQEKINTYINFVESGELLTVYPDAAGKMPTIDVVMRLAPSSAGAEFFDRVRPILRAAGCDLRVRVLE